MYTKPVTIHLFNAQGSASRVIPMANAFLLQNEHATYKIQDKVPHLFKKKKKNLLTYGKQTFKQKKPQKTPPPKNPKKPPSTPNPPKAS